MRNDFADRWLKKKKKAWFTVYPARLRLGVESHKRQSYLSICIPWNGVEDPGRGKSHREVHLIF